MTDSATATTTQAKPSMPTSTGYAPANGLELYYEIHGESSEAGDTLPILLLHGAYMTGANVGPLLTGLAADRQVIAPDLQAHGRTADIDRPITYEALADDCAALLDHLGIARVDAVGYSMGGATVLQLAIRHPDRVRAIVPISAGYRHDGMQPALMEMLPQITIESFAGSPMEAAYQAVAPRPEDFPVLVQKLTTLDTTPFAWDDQISRITAPTLIVTGDADASTIEHMVSLFRLLGGGQMADFAGIPSVRLAVLPGTGHFMPFGSGLLDRHALLLDLIPAFLAAPDPVPAPSFG